jgi:hypothetical protein
MSTERPQRHVVDELLAGSVEALPDERAWPTHPALQGEGLQGEGQERLAEREERLARCVERMAEVERRLARLEARLTSEARERESTQEHRFERASRARVEGELERLRGSFSALTPLVHALHQAMGEIQATLAQGPEAGAAHGGGEGGEAGGGGGTKQAPPAAADSHAAREPRATGAEAGAAAPFAGTGFAAAELGAANLLRALVDVLERWRAPGAAG